MLTTGLFRLQENYPRTFAVMMKFNDMYHSELNGSLFYCNL